MDTTIIKKWINDHKKAIVNTVFVIFLILLIHGALTLTISNRVIVRSVSIELPESVTVKMGETLQLEPVVVLNTDLPDFHKKFGMWFDQNEYTGKICYISSLASYIASIDENFVITPVSEGTTIIEMATSDGVSAMTYVTVVS